MSKRLILVLTLAFVVGIAFSAYAEVQNLKVGGDILIRGVGRNSFQTDDTSETERALLSGVRVRVDADLTDNVSTCVRLLNERVWGDEDDEFDPIAQVRQFTVAMTLKVNNPEDIPKEDPLFMQMNEEGKTEVKEIVPMRLYTLQEIDALARCAGLEMVAKYGALDKEVAMTEEDDAYRMVCVRRCKE